jgi:hypothetical protein
MILNSSQREVLDALAHAIQTCIEFGYYQSSDSTNQPFGNLFPVSFSLQQCMDIYNIAGPNVAWTNTDYGGLNISGTRIVMPNGSIDPWHALSVLNTTNTGIVPIFIEGTAHWYVSCPLSALFYSIQYLHTHIQKHRKTKTHASIHKGICTCTPTHPTQRQHAASLAQRSCQPCGGPLRDHECARRLVDRDKALNLHAAVVEI